MLLFKTHNLGYFKKLTQTICATMQRKKSKHQYYICITLLYRHNDSPSMSPMLQNPSTHQHLLIYTSPYSNRKKKNQDKLNGNIFLRWSYTQKHMSSYNNIRIFRVDSLPLDNFGAEAPTPKLSSIFLYDLSGTSVPCMCNLLQRHWLQQAPNRDVKLRSSSG